MDLTPSQVRSLDTEAFAGRRQSWTTLLPATIPCSALSRISAQVRCAQVFQRSGGAVGSRCATPSQLARQKLPSLARVCVTQAWVACTDTCAGRRSQGSFDLKGVLPPVPDNVRLVKVGSNTPPYLVLI